MVKPPWIQTTAIFSTLLFIAASPVAAGPDGYKWIDPPVSGAFSAASSWAGRGGERPGPPGPGDGAIFPPGTYTVTCNGAVTAYTTVTGNVTFVGSYDVGQYDQGSQVVLRGAALKGDPFTVSSTGSLLVDGSELTINDFTFDSPFGLGTRLTGINGAQIKTSGQREGEFLPDFRLEGGSTWQHTGALKVNRCFLSGGSLLSADTLTVRLPELDGGRLQAGRLNGGGHAKDGSNVSADTASLSDWLLEGSGTGLHVSGTTVPGLIYADVSIKSGASLTAGALADNAWYTVDGSGSTLAVAGDITPDGPQKVTVQNQGRGSAGTLTRAYVIVRDAGSLFTYATRAEDSTLNILNGGRVNGGSIFGPTILGRVSGCSVTGAGSALVLSGDLELGAFDVGSLNVSDGGRLECATGSLNGGQVGGGSSSSIYGADSFWLTRSGLIVGYKTGLATLNVGDGGRVEVQGAAMAVGLQPGSEGRMTVDGGSSPSPSALDTRLAQETGVGVEGKGFLRVFNHGRILARKLTVGVKAGSDGSVEVVGAGTSLEVGETLEIGQSGLGQMTINVGGLATAPDVLVGSNTKTNLLRLTGAGSTLTIAKSLHVGETGLGRLSIEQGARVVLPGIFDPTNTVGEASVADQPGSVGTVSVNGAGSALVGELGALIVGTQGQGTLNVSNGGDVNFTVIVIGGGAGGSGVATISGAGSVARAPDFVAVGGSSAKTTGPGELTVSAGGLLQPRFALNVYKPGVVRLTGGAAIVGQTAEAAIPNTVLVANLGTLRLGGRLIGSVLLRPGGTFLPGASPGRATIEGNLTLADGGALELEMGGSGAGIGYDQIVATETVKLAGRLDLVFRDGFAPNTGQVFELVSAGTIIGDFSEVVVRGLAPGFTYSLAKLGGHSLRLTATSAGVSTTTPELSIARSTAENVVVSWPDYVTGWTFEQAAALQTESWQPVLAPGNTVTLPTAATVEFFRLTSP